MTDQDLFADQIINVFVSDTMAKNIYKQMLQNMKYILYRRSFRLIVF